MAIFLKIFFVTGFLFGKRTVMTFPLIEKMNQYVFLFFSAISYLEKLSHPLYVIANRDDKNQTTGNALIWHHQ